MIKNIVIEVQERGDLGKNANRRLRAVGNVPGVVYGLGRPPVNVAIGSRKIEEVLGLETGKNTIFTLALAGQDRSRAVMIKALQRDPVSERLVHVDFVRVDLEREVRVNVPIRLLGIAEGVKNEGGIMEFVQRAVEVSCLPADIPEHIDVDVSGLHVNQHLAVKDLPETAKVVILDEPETILCVVAVPKAEEAPAPAEEAVAVETAAAAEPEVIKKGKEASAEAGEAKKA